MKIRFNPTVVAVRAELARRIAEQKHVIAEEAETGDEQSPVIIANASRYIAELQAKDDMLASHNREDVLAEIDL